MTQIYDGTGDRQGVDPDLPVTQGSRAREKYHAHEGESRPYIIADDYLVCVTL
jgi:hypothetical protein